MRRVALTLAIVGALVLAAAAAAADVALRVVSQTSSSITFEYDAAAGAAGYAYFANGAQVSRTFNPAQLRVTFAKGASSYRVAPLDVTQRPDGACYPTGTSSCVPPPPPPTPQCSDGIDNDGDGAVDAADAGCSGPTDNDETNPPPTGNTVTVVDRKWTCSGRVDYDLVKVTVSGNLGRTDAVQIASGCTGRIGRLEVDTANADGVHIGAGAHDLVIESGYVHSSGVCGSCAGAVHVDGIQALGGQRITMRNLDVNYPTATNSALYINAGSGGLDRPTDVVCDGCTFRRSDTRNRVVRIGNSLRSGIRNSVVYWCGTGSRCDAPQAPAIWGNGLATTPVGVTYNPAPTNCTGETDPDGKPCGSSFTGPTPDNTLRLTG